MQKVWPLEWGLEQLENLHQQLLRMLCKWMLSPTQFSQLANIHLSACSNLAVGIGIQNFPEGLAVSLPLRAAGMGTVKSFW